MPGVRQIILETLAQRGPLGIEEIAQATQLSKMAARYHMRLLERDGLVRRCGPAYGGSVGRPSTPYVLAERAHALLPKQYDALATLLLIELVRTLGTERARGLVRRAGRRAAGTAPSLVRRAGIRSRLKHLARSLSARGYRMSWECTNKGAEVIVHDCPYSQVARTQPLVCDMDRALIGALLRVPSAKVVCTVAHDGECHFMIQN